MKAPSSPLWIRILGYGGTALLVAAAVAVIAVQFTGGVKSGRIGTAAPSSGPVAPVRTGGQAAPSAASGGGDGALTGVAQCGASSAGYQRSGSTVKVTVTLPATGIVSASVQLKGQGSPETKALNVAGEQSPHVFEFTDVPAAQTQSISVSVLSDTDFKTCTLAKQS